MKRRVLLVISLFTFLFPSCVSYTNPIKENPIGQKYHGSINFRNMEIPLPKGEWTMVGRGYSDDDNYVQIALAKVIGNKPHSIVFMSRDSLKNSFSGYLPSKNLERKDIHYVVSNSNRKGEAQDGWCINHIRVSFGEKITKANKELYKYIVDNKLIMPGNFIQIHHRFTGKSIKKKFFSYNLYVNPEVEGFEPPTNAEWASSDWNTLKINSDPKKVAYIEKLKKEGAAFHQKLKAAFGE